MINFNTGPPAGMEPSRTGHFEGSVGGDSLQHIDTQDVDLENKDPVKDDSSDGRGDWTLRRFLAIVSLAGIYVGEYPFNTSTNHLAGAGTAQVRRLLYTLLAARWHTSYRS